FATDVYTLKGHTRLTKRGVIECGRHLRDMEHDLPDKRFHVGSLDVRPARHDHHQLHEIPQLPHIARPIVPRQDIESLLRNRTRAQSLLLHVHLNEMPHERGNILATITKRRHVKREDSQPEIKILPEGTFTDLIDQGLVRGGNHPDIDFDQLGAPKTLKTLFLQDPEHLRLGCDTHV